MIVLSRAKLMTKPSWNSQNLHPPTYSILQPIVTHIPWAYWTQRMCGKETEGLVAISPAFTCCWTPPQKGPRTGCAHIWSAPESRLEHPSQSGACSWLGQLLPRQISSSLDALKERLCHQDLGLSPCKTGMTSFLHTSYLKEEFRLLRSGQCSWVNKSSISPENL